MTAQLTTDQLIAAADIGKRLTELSTQLSFLQERGRYDPGDHLCLYFAESRRINIEYQIFVNTIKAQMAYLEEKLAAKDIIWSEHEEDTDD